jgi:hypothetical protein
VSKATYPKYRVSQWLDTSEQAMESEVGVVLYGIEQQSEPRGSWRHVGMSGKAMLFRERANASAKIDALKAQGERA